MARPALSQAQVQEFRHRAADVAMSMFMQQGYEQFSLRTLAREMGCSHATPYRYFKDKAEIFAVVRAEGFARFAAALEQGLSGGDDAEERLRLLARAYFDFAQQEPAAFTVIFEMGQPAADEYPFVDEAGFAAWSVLFRTVRQAVDAQVLCGDVLLLAHSMWAGIHGIASLQLAGKLTVGLDADALLPSMMTALIEAHRFHNDGPRSSKRTRATGSKS